MKQVLIMLVMVLGLVSCKSPEARPPESVKSGSFIKASVERNKKLNEAEYAKIQTIINKNPDIDYIASENGFWYYYKQRLQQDTIQPRFGDQINFSYNVADLNGNMIYSKEQLGDQDYVMEKEELFTGLREGLKLMKPTEQVTFIFPSQTAFGYYGDDNKIGTNVPLICEVTLNTITQNNND
ncbi:MAG: gliding motility-associated peptidyl-prolyl isomerase GldI [Bacteroidota bacterium]